jgi:hypothetical protein
VTACSCSVILKHLRTNRHPRIHLEQCVQTIKFCTVAQNGTSLMSSFWRLEFWDGSISFVKFVNTRPGWNEELPKTSVRIRPRPKVKPDASRTQVKDVTA